MNLTSRVAPGAAVLLLMTLGGTAPAFAQHWTNDARRIGMGGFGTSSNAASKMAAEEVEYKTIVIPLGLFQVLGDLDVFNPDSEEFNPILAAEYVISPLHYTFDRKGSEAGRLLADALRNGELDRDLNTYRGFVPVTQPIAYGLGNPSWGGTIPVHRSEKRRHGIYVGAGPYIGFRGVLTIDEELTELLASDMDVYIPNAHFPMSSQLRGDFAAAITGGYRGVFTLDTGGDRDGVYVAGNYHYVRGFWFEDGDFDVRFDTDSQGLLTVDPTLPAPVALNRLNATTGNGFAIDAGVALVRREWELGFGVNGIANRIEWSDVEATRYALSEIFTGGDFVESPTIPVADVTSELPVDYTGEVVYRADDWTGVVQLSERVIDNPADEDRYDGTIVRLGFEYRFVMFEPRGGTYYTRERWHPSVGVGLNFGTIGVDTAVFWGEANAERDLRPTVAVSLRIGARNGR